MPGSSSAKEAEDRRCVPGPAILSEELEICPMICFTLEAMVRGALDGDAVVTGE